MKTKYDIIPVPGFWGAGLHSGVKRKKKDLGVIIAEGPCTCAGVFTQNIVKAAPVILSEMHLKKSDHIRALIVNSGNANACTGPQGMVDASEMVTQTASTFGLLAHEVMLAATGIIGLPLNMDKISQGIERLPSVLSADLTHFGESILTTDTYLKVASLVVDIAGKPVTFLGLAKGSGMIHPNMATMLGFILTDAPVEKSFMQSVLSEATDVSFNMISVDGDTSTNDMVLMLASGVQEIETLHAKSDYAGLFSKAVHAISESLAVQIAKDGEGATTLLEVVVEGAHSLPDAKKAAKSVVQSSLVKAAFFGQDANWGRIVCALGYSGATFNPEKVDVTLTSRMGAITLLEKGQPVAFNEAHASNVLRGDVIEVLIDLNDGFSKAKAWGCDLSYDYVKINGAYRT